MPRAGIALGSNLGDRLAHLHAAIAALRRIAVHGEPVLIAPVYQTSPRHCPPDSPDFLNTVIEISFKGDAPALLAKTQAIELKLGRVRSSERNVPRVIDIDLLYLGDTRLNHGALILPHPRITGRRFVLQPLADIRPELILPGHQQTIQEILQTLQTDEPPLMALRD